MKLKLLILIFVSIGLLVSTSYSGAVYSDLEDLVDAMRRQTEMTNTTLLSDSQAYDICKGALLWVSTDIGGYEKIHRFATAEGTAFYALEDSITEVLHVSLMSTDYLTHRSLRNFDPELFEDAFGLSKLEGTDDAVTPKGYSVFADTIQLMPAPANVDSVFLKCYYEHPVPTASDSAIHLRPAYTEAALAFACYKAYMARHLYQEAAFYDALYMKLKNSLRERYTPKTAIVRTEGQ